MMMGNQQYDQEWMRSNEDKDIDTQSDQPTDKEIHEKILMRMKQHVEINAGDIEVEVKDGTVTLRGTVDDRKDRDMVQANVERIFGVIEVRNELKMRHYDKEEEIREKVARNMADKFPGGPTLTGPAGYTDPNEKPRRED